MNADELDDAAFELDTRRVAQGKRPSNNSAFIQRMAEEQRHQQMTHTPDPRYKRGAERTKAIGEGLKEVGKMINPVQGAKDLYQHGRSDLKNFVQNPSIEGGVNMLGHGLTALELGALVAAPAVSGPLKALSKADDLARVALRGGSKTGQVARGALRTLGEYGPEILTLGTAGMVAMDEEEDPLLYQLMDYLDARSTQN